MSDVTCVIVVMVPGEKKYFRKVVQSVVDQTYRTKIVIVFNDTFEWLPQIAKSLQEDIVLVPVAKTLASRARNIGVSLTDTEFVGFLDGDDFWAPMKIESQLYTITSQSLDLVGCDHLLVDSDGKKFAHAMCRNIPMPSSWLVRTEVMMERPFDVEAKCHEDEVWWRNNRKFLKIGRLPKEYLMYTVRSNSASSGVSNKKRKELMMHFSRTPFSKFLLLTSTSILRLAFVRSYYKDHSSW